MARSHQKGTVVLRGTVWYGYFNQKVIDPETGDTRWKKQSRLLGSNSEMGKRQAMDSLGRIVAQELGSSGRHDRPTQKDVVTFGWFTRNRFYPLKEGGSWRESTAASKKEMIEADILGKFGDYALSDIDKFMLQTHLNRLAKYRSAGRVEAARYYMNAIFDEAVDQDFLLRNPARKLAIPKDVRPVDKTTLTWEQLHAVLAEMRLRDWVLLAMDCTEAFRPSELFALQWKGFNYEERTIMVTQTVYRGKLRPYAKTEKALGKRHLPEGLAEELYLWMLECPDTRPEAYIFPNARKRNRATTRGFIRADNYLRRVLKPIAEKLGLLKLNFQVLRRTVATLAQELGNPKDVQGIMRHVKLGTTTDIYMQEIESNVKRTQDALYSKLVLKPKLAG